MTASSLLGSISQRSIRPRTLLMSPIPFSVHLLVFLLFRGKSNYPMIALSVSFTLAMSLVAV